MQKFFCRTDPPRIRMPVKFSGSKNILSKFLEKYFASRRRAWFPCRNRLFRGLDSICFELLQHQRHLHCDSDAYQKTFGTKLVANPTRSKFWLRQLDFNIQKLEAVRWGPWKLAIAPQALHNKPGGGDTEMVKHTGPRLYNLDTDIGELTDVAAQYPDIVAKLQKFIVQMDGDLGTQGTGPGVRPPARVTNPKPLLKRIDTEYD